MTKPTEPDSANETWLKAKLHLTEAENLDPRKTPSAAIHSAYYAMHHAARAALIRTDADKAPQKHHAVINRFGQIAKQSPDERLRAAGRLLNAALDERLDADYGPPRSSSAETAEECVRNARTFLTICGDCFDLASPA